MKIKDRTALAGILESLAREGALYYSSSGITQAGLNVRDVPRVALHIAPIMRHLYASVRRARIKYDAVASIPTGGDAWAEGFAKIVSEQEGRQVPRLLLAKESTRRFSVADGQPVKRGARVLLIDDTLFLGRTSSAAVEVISGARYKIACLVFPVEIGDEGRRKWDSKGVRVFSLFDTQLVAGLHSQRRL